jgi:carbonic anhydrase
MRAHTKDTQATMTPQKALAFLKEGNDRFVKNLKANRNLLEQVNETRDGQWPFATILSCIDSRTSAELIFDQGLGDIFSVRIAGNVVNTDVVGSLEFACQIAGSKLIVVLGHTSCGAIKGACDHVELGNLTELLSKIQPAVYEESQTHDPAKRNSANPEFVEQVADLNVRRSVRTILNRSYILEHLIEEGKVAVIGGKHDLASGQVQFFDDSWVHDELSIKSFTGRRPIERPAGKVASPRHNGAVAARGNGAAHAHPRPRGGAASRPRPEAIARQSASRRPSVGARAR